MDKNTNEHRIKSSVRNTKIAVITSVVMCIFSFIERMVFNRYLITDYLGFYSLFRNIITILSVAELGLTASITYALYEPLAKDNKEEIKAIIEFFRKAFFCIGTIIILASIVVLPFLKYLVKTEVPILHVQIYFILFVLHTALGYFLYYKSILFTADQKKYVSDLVFNSCITGGYILFIVVMITTQNFFLLLCCFSITIYC